MKVFLLIFIFSFSALATDVLHTGKPRVVIFLSRTCPCTQVNIPYINELAKAHPEIEFYGIHSVKGATTKDVSELVENYKPSFQVIEDHDLKIANELKANRTPQAFILDDKNAVIYSGGITDRTNPKSAKKTYLKNALAQWQNHQPITEKETRSLGCVILR